MKTYQLGAIAEARIIAHFISEGYDVFAQFDGHAPFDLVIHKDGKLLRVEARYTSARYENTSKYRVVLRKTNRSGNKSCNLDLSSVDLIAAFVAPRNEVIVIPVGEITSVGQIIV